MNDITLLAEVLKKLADKLDSEDLKNEIADLVIAKLPNGDEVAY